MKKSNRELNEIENKIRGYFGSRWTTKDITYFISKPRYKLDISAIQNNLNTPLRNFVLRGGKRLRPLLFIQALKAFGVNYKEYLDIAVLVELVHNGTLVLDDIEDNGLLRRGKPTCHKIFGLDTATNVGISLHVLPLKILMSNNKMLTSEQQLRLWKIYTDEIINVSFGQTLDIYWHKTHPKNISIDKYLEMVRLKTGSLMRMSLRMAVAIANKDQKVENVYQRFAENIGVAFQIIDDCLDLKTVSVQDSFGKTVGNDITEGKLSLPVVIALKKLKKRKRVRLLNILHAHTRNKKIINEAINIIKSTDAINQSTLMARQMLLQSWEEVNKIGTKDMDLTELRELTEFIVKRTY